MAIPTRVEQIHLNQETNLKTQSKNKIRIVDRTPKTAVDKKLEDQILRDRKALAAASE